MDCAKRFSTAAAVAVAIASLLYPAEAGAQDALPAPGNTPPPAAGSYEQQISYAFGINIAAELEQSGVPLDLKALFAGISDATQGKDYQFSQAQLQAAMQRFSQEAQARAEQRMFEQLPPDVKQAAMQNQQRGAAFLAENGKKEGVVTTESGLQYRVLARGEGKSPALRDAVSCNYEGRLISGKVFDASAKHGGPAQFPLMRVIPGWTEVLQLMKEGDQFEVYVPSKLAYGLRGSPPDIGPSETLIFKIHLLEVLP